MFVSQTYGEEDWGSFSRNLYYMKKTGQLVFLFSSKYVNYKSLITKANKFIEHHLVEGPVMSDGAPFQPFYE